MLVHTADGQDSFIDYREVAPAAQDAYTWLDEEGNVKNNGTANSRGGLATAFPARLQVWSTPSRTSVPAT